jgi:sugar/nucleoside kinase (ribokinase family)
MSQPQGIIAGGNWIVDHVKVIDAWPPQDALANILSQSQGNGGSPYNILKNLAKLGAPFPLQAVGLVGDDPDGNFILTDCHRHGIDTTQLRMTTVAATSYTDVMTVRGDGRRTFFHQRGANAKLSPENFIFPAKTVSHFHLGYALLLDTLDEIGPGGLPGMGEVLARARVNGLKTSLDCVSENSDRFGSVIVPVLPAVDVLFVNDFETEKLTGLALGRGSRLNRPLVEEAGQRLLELGVRQWAIIHFPEGACACSRDGDRVWCPALNIPESLIAGAAGAGDAFAAGVLYGLHEDWPISRCLQLGVCTAAASLREVTCSDGVRSLNECLQLADQWGFRDFAP